MSKGWQEDDDQAGQETIGRQAETLIHEELASAAIEGEQSDEADEAEGAAAEARPKAKRTKAAKGKPPKGKPDLKGKDKDKDKDKEKDKEKDREKARGERSATDKKKGEAARAREAKGAARDDDATRLDSGPPAAMTERFPDLEAKSAPSETGGAATGSGATNRERPVSQMPGPAARPDRPTPGSDPLIGQVLDQYRIVRRLGAGAMGAVYLADQLNIGRQAALKVMLPELSQDEEMVGRFNREVRSASALNHPNIVQIYSFGSREDGALYFAMEYVEGESLGSLVRRAKLPLPIVCDIGAQLADALALAHQAKLVHRDLKPENILVKRIHDRLVPKICDFGIAKVVSEGKTATLLTRDGKIFGTPNYMSPEQAQGKAVDGRSDVYSLGVLLYQLITGKLPIKAPTPVAQVMAVAQLPPDPIPADVARELPKGLADLMMRMLSKEPGGRPGNMLAIRDELALAGERAAGLKRGGSPLRRLALMTLALAVLAAFAFAAWRYVPAFQALVARMLPGVAAPSGGSTGADGTAPRGGGAVASTGPKLLQASEQPPPAWIKELEADTEGDTWGFELGLKRQADLSQAKERLRNLGATQLSLALASKVQLPGFGQAVYLPIISAQSAMDKRLLELAMAQEREPLAALTATRDEHESHMYSMLEARFPGLLRLQHLYWEEYSDGTGGRYYDVYAGYEAKPGPADLGYYQTSSRAAALGLTVTHFFPGLTWVHGNVNGAVVLEVTPGAPGELAGVKVGDVILEVQGRKADGLALFDEIAKELEIAVQKKSLKMVVSRNGKQLTLDLLPKAKPRPGKRK